MPVYGDNQLMTVEKCNDVKGHCFEINIKPIMKDINDIKISLAKLPEELINKLSEKFAGKHVETDLKTLINKQENRQHEWIKNIIMAAIGAVLALLLKKL